MKRIITMIIALFLMLPFFANAQVEQGTWFLRGSSDLSFSAGKEKYDYAGDKQDGDKYMFFDLRPAVGYAVINRLPVGIFLDVSMESYKDPDNSDNKTRYTQLAVGPFVRYYFVDLNNFMPFAEGSVGFGSTAYKVNDEDPSKLGYFGFRLGAGFSYFFNDHVGLDLHLGYQQETLTDKDAGETGNETYKYIMGGLFTNLGIVVSLGGGGGSRQKSSGQGKLDVRQ